MYLINDFMTLIIRLTIAWTGTGSITALCYQSPCLLGHIRWAVYVLECFASFDYYCCIFFFHQCRLSSLDTATPLLNRWSFSKVLWRSPGVEGNSRSHFEVPALQHKTLDYIVPVHLCHSYVLNRTHACDTCWHDPLHLWLPCAARVCVVACPWLVPVDLDPDWSGTWSDPPICLIQLEEQHSLSWNRPTVVAAWFLCGAHRCVILKNWL